MTNAEKFKEVFGFAPSKNDCPVISIVQCWYCKGFHKDTNCKDSDWWNSEYKENRNDQF